MHIAGPVMTADEARSLEMIAYLTILRERLNRRATGRRVPRIMPPRIDEAVPEGPY